MAKAKDTKKSEAKAEDRLSRGQGPRTQTQVFSKKRSSKKVFQAISKQSGLEKIFSVALQNFNHSKSSAVLEPRTGQFLKTGGFEAKAKDLTFEGLTKDFKMCPRGGPRGQGRPRGLHLCKPLSLWLNFTQSNS